MQNIQQNEIIKQKMLIQEQRELVAKLSNCASNKRRNCCYSSYSPALPCLVRGYPSKLVATVDATPGAFISIEDVEPPNIAP